MGVVNVFTPRMQLERIITGTRKWFARNGDENTKAIIGISGGKDSTFATYICCEALGKDRVVGIMMPNGFQEDADDTQAVVEHFDIEYYRINIEQQYNVGLYYYKNILELEINDIVRFNRPARLRMATLYDIAAMLHGRVICTDNYSEWFTGYSTKWGDSCGDFAPFQQYTVTEIKSMMRYAKIPDRFINKIPHDGMSSPDEERFGFTYEQLDHFIRDKYDNYGLTEEVIDKIYAMHERSEHKRNPMDSIKYPH